MKSESKPEAELDLAIEAYRSQPSGPEILSEEARAAVLEAVRAATARPSRLAPLFVPLQRLALAAGVPLVLSALALTWLVMERAPAPSSASEAQFVQVSKVGDRVVFTIANHDREHTVFRSQHPDRFDLSGAMKVSGGSFVDRLDSGPEVVFYRID